MSLNPFTCRFCQSLRSPSSHLPINLGPQLGRRTAGSHRQIHNIRDQRLDPQSYRSYGRHAPTSRRISTIYESIGSIRSFTSTRTWDNNIQSQSSTRQPKPISGLPTISDPDSDPALPSPPDAQSNPSLPISELGGGVESAARQETERQANSQEWEGIELVDENGKPVKVEPRL